MLENGNKNQWNLPCWELLLSLICTRSLAKNCLLHLSYVVVGKMKQTLFFSKLRVYIKDNNNSPSLRSKRFCLVSEQRNTEEGDFRYGPREK